MVDYVNPSAHQPKGVVYNARQRIGGIRYYNPKLEPPKASASGESSQLIEPKFDYNNKDRSQYKINLGARERPSPEPVFNYDYSKLPERTVEKPKPKKLKPKENPYQNTLKKEDLEFDILGTSYIVPVGKRKINFSDEGIHKAKISYKDQEWLKKAQHYFLHATERGKKIGSAEEYTTMDILVALWSTAVQAKIDPKRFLVQIYNETRFNPNLKGRAGERGLGQFKRATAKGAGYSWNKIVAGTSTYAYQAKVAADYVAKVGESTYNGGGRKSRKYVKRIDKHLRRISKV